jgi:16S rRNA (cytosine967-C5)-methyltransferase
MVIVRARVSAWASFSSAGSRGAVAADGLRSQTSMPVSPARAAAYDILFQVEQEDAYASELLHSARYAELSTADHGLTTELVMGVLRWRSLIDSAISHVSSQRLEKLDLEVLTALRLAAYQLGWLDRIPPRAAIHESVELVKRARKRSAAPFANAILRKLAQSTSASHPRSELIRAATTPTELAAASSHPLWIVQRWISQFGLQVAGKICDYDQSPPATAIRVRAASAEEELRRDNVQLTAGAFLSDARRVHSGDVTKTKAFAEGRVAIQDEASQLIAALVGEGSRILDCCAAPGGKTWSIADRNPRSTIVAVESHSHRARLLRQRVAANNVQVLTADMRDLPVAERFNRVLVDVPCSGTGTLARHPEIKWRLKPEDLTDLHSRQLSMLQAAMKHVAPAGKLVYSTCSLEPDEDESVIDESVRANQSFRLLDARSELERLDCTGRVAAIDLASLVQGVYLRTFPGVHPCDGFFAAILERSQ